MIFVSSAEVTPEQNAHFVFMENSQVPAVTKISRVETLDNRVFIRVRGVSECNQFLTVKNVSPFCECRMSDIQKTNPRVIISFNDGVFSGVVCEVKKGSGEIKFILEERL